MHSDSWSPAEDVRKRSIRHHWWQPSHLPSAANVWSAKILGRVGSSPERAPGIDVLRLFLQGYADLFAWAASPVVSEYSGKHVVAGRACSLWTLLSKILGTSTYPSRPMGIDSYMICVHLYSL